MIRPCLSQDRWKNASGRRYARQAGAGSGPAPRLLGMGVLVVGRVKDWSRRTDCLGRCTTVQLPTDCVSCTTAIIPRAYDRTTCMSGRKNRTQMIGRVAGGWCIIPVTLIGRTDSRSACVKDSEVISRTSVLSMAKEIPDPNFLRDTSSTSASCTHLVKSTRKNWLACMASIRRQSVTSSYVRRGRTSEEYV